jgi:hypothetical protein
VVLQSAVYQMPFGWMDVRFDPDSLAWGMRSLGHFVPEAELAAHGLRNRYRRPGVGAPLSASADLPEGDTGVSDFAAPHIKVPVNAFLRIEHPRAQLARARMDAQMELRVAFEASTVVIGDATIPLELETTSFLSEVLAESAAWVSELKSLMVGDRTHHETSLVGFYPYSPGRIPVVLVHGTASSAGRWADMLNDLANDPRIFERYQFWFFT